MISKSKKTITRINNNNKMLFAHYKFLIKQLLNILPCATGENFEISSISIEKNTYFEKAWDTHMLTSMLRN